MLEKTGTVITDPESRLIASKDSYFLTISYPNWGKTGYFGWLCCLGRAIFIRIDWFLVRKGSELSLGELM